MAGLMDFFGSGVDDPKSQAIMGLLQGVQSGGGWNGGLVAANNNMLAGRREAITREMALMQLEQHRMALAKAKRDEAEEQGLLGLQSKFFQPGSPGLGGTDAVNSALPPEYRIGAQAPIPARGPQFDVKGYTSAALNQGFMRPLDAIKLQQALGKENQINKLDAKDFTPASLARFQQTQNYGDLERLDKLHFADTGGGITGINQFTGKPVGAVPKTGDPYKDLILNDGAGGFRSNSPLIGAKQSIAKAGAARTDVRIENKMGDSIAKEIGPILTDSATAANGAAQQIDAANRVIKAVDSNMIFAGPTATLRLKGAQIAGAIGMGGKDDPEKIANTRSAIRGLAEMTLQGRKQMRGQGAITESESKLAERAISGDIDDLTAGEIKQLAQASSRSAKFVHQQHEQKLKVVKGNPNMANLAPFYEPMPLPEETTAAPPLFSPDAIAAELARRRQPR